MAGWLLLAAIAAMGVAEVVLGARLERVHTGPIPAPERADLPAVLAEHRVTDGHP